MNTRKIAANLVTNSLYEAMNIIVSSDESNGEDAGEEFVEETERHMNKS